MKPELITEAIGWENICESKDCPVKSEPYPHTHCLTEKAMKERLENSEWCYKCVNCWGDVYFGSEWYGCSPWGGSCVQTVFDCQKCGIGSIFGEAGIVYRSQVFPFMAILEKERE